VKCSESLRKPEHPPLTHFPTSSCPILRVSLLKTSLQGTYYDKHDDEALQNPPMGSFFQKRKKNCFFQEREVFLFFP
jgi:hypothetical protein